MRALTGLASRLRDKNLMTWLPGYARQRLERLRDRPREGPRHLLFALCDHYEPLWGDAPMERARARVHAWLEGYPAVADRFRDSTGRSPRHSFFYPGEQYRPELLDPLTDLARRGYGEVELHLHHDGDTAETVAADIHRYLRELADHGHLARDHGGRLRFAFIHGNWCLANARSDGRYCGVDSEVALLWDAGCYADFTFPAAPNESQPPIVNQIYWPVGDLARRRAHDTGSRARVGEVMRDRILFIEGPLALARRPGRWSVRIENGNVDGGDPPTPARVRTWVDQNICVEGRPEWVFVKVHTHGALERNAPSVIGSGGTALHETLTRQYNDGARWRLHYVTAREMYNVAIAAMSGERGDPAEFRDYALSPPPIAG
jgi:hypothetical protein